MGKIKKVVRTNFIDEDEGFIYTFEPIEDSLTIKETSEGFEVRYLVRDENPESPDTWEDDNLFLVNYHRDFDVRRDNVITQDEISSWYKSPFFHDMIKKGSETYWMFPLSCLVHSGIWLSLNHSFISCDPGGWDTSHVGAVLVSKKEWKREKEALKAAENLVTEWNQYLSGDVYGIVKETYDTEKKQIDQQDIQDVWGFYGYKYALEALQTEI